MAEKTNIDLIDVKAEEAATNEGGGCCGTCNCGGGQ